MIRIDFYEVFKTMIKSLLWQQIKCELLQVPAANVDCKSPTGPTLSVCVNILCMEFFLSPRVTQNKLVL